jgi:tRNA pseudouridine38-40 synthase
MPPECFRLTLQYEGTRYHGWQSQANSRTVQGTLAAAASEVFGRAVEIGGAGRTDAGVHALAQVAHLRMAERSELPPGHRRDKVAIARNLPPVQGAAPGSGRHLGRLRSELNLALPQDIVVLRLEAAAPRFHARHDAVSRFYIYQVAIRKSAFSKRFVWWVPDRLDAGRMERAAALLPGRHDFAAFGDKRGEKKSTLVHVSRAELAWHGDLLQIRIGASHFLWKMVRRLVGSIVEIGKGNLTENEFERMLRTAEGTAAAWTAPASGLFLEKVAYTDADVSGPLQPLLWA